MKTFWNILNKIKLPSIISKSVITLASEKKLRSITVSDSTIKIKLCAHVLWKHMLKRVILRVQLRSENKLVPNASQLTWDMENDDRRV